MTASAYDVTAAIIEKKPGLDQMQLHKLAYFVQAACLAWFDEPAFTDKRIEAWTYGPMVRGVAGTYQSYDNQPIYRPERGDSSHLPPRVAWVVGEIVRQYGHLTGPQLANLAKRPDSPWRVARGDTPDGEQSNEEITITATRDYHRLHGVVWAEPANARERDLAVRASNGDVGALADLFELSTGVRPQVVAE